VVIGQLQRFAEEDWQSWIARVIVYPFPQSIIIDRGISCTRSLMNFCQGVNIAIRLSLTRGESIDPPRASLVLRASLSGARSREKFINTDNHQTVQSPVRLRNSPQSRDSAANQFSIACWRCLCSQDPLFRAERTLFQHSDLTHSSTNSSFGT
jgi:hypothetical protein